MNYLSKAFRKNLGKKAKHCSVFCSFILLTVLFSSGQSPVKVPANGNSLLNLNKGFQAYGFRTQEQWNQHWSESLQPYYPGAILPETGQPVEYMLYPYWQGTLYDKYQFWNIGRMGYFAYIINPENGTPELTYSWTVRNFVEDAKPEGTKIDLVLFCSGKDEINLFLCSETARQNCISLATQLVTKRDSLFSTEKTKLLNADGINVFFPDFGFSKKRAFGLFIKDLHAETVQKNPAMKLIVTFPPHDTIHFKYLIGLEKYINELHFADYDYRGIIRNKATVNDFQQRFKDKNYKPGFFEGMIAEIRLARFTNPFIENPGDQEEGNNWEIYFLAIALILLILLVLFLFTVFCCRFSQIFNDHSLLFMLLALLLIIEIVFLFLFMVEEMNHDIWLINIENENANYFLLTPLVFILLFPAMKLLQNRAKLP